MISENVEIFSIVENTIEEEDKFINFFKIKLLPISKNSSSRNFYLPSSKILINK